MQKSVSLTELTRFLQAWAPFETAEAWDNAGVLVRCGEAVTGVLCALDITPATVAEAEAAGCNVVVSHHPVIFRPLKGLSQRDVPALLLRAGISAVCLHTNLDRAAGGVNDVLAARLGLLNIEPFAEGIGRTGLLPRPMRPQELAAYTAKALDTPVKYAPAEKSIVRVAVVSGSGGDYAKEAAEAGADCLVTGEAGHHDALDALAAGISVVAATHFATETLITDALAQRIGAAYPALRVLRSKADADPFLYDPACEK